MRRVCLVLLLATACSGSPSAEPGPLGPKELAQAGVLTTKDLPAGYAEKQIAVPSARTGCLATSVLADADGAEYVRGQVAVTSTASVASSGAEALAKLAALAPTGTCLRDIVAARLGASGIEVTGFAATPSQIDLPHAYAFSTDVTATTPGGFAFTVRGYSVGAVVGSTQITLAVTKSADTGITLAETVALLKKLTERVAAAS